MAENNQENVQENTQNNQSNADAENNTKNSDNFAEKFEEILNKRIDGVAKSILKANGMDEDEEIKSFIESYHQRKETESKKINDEMEALKKENENLKAEKFKNELKETIKGLSGKLGFDEKYVNQIAKLADLSEVKTNDGKISEEKLTESINKVLEECDAFKVSKNKEVGNNKFTVIGANHNTENISMQEDKMTLAQKMKIHSNK